MKQICELNDKIVLGTEGLSTKAPRLTARAIVKNQDGLYAVMYADKFKLHSLPGGGVEDGEDVLTALRREVYEETGCVCDEVQELGIVAENRASLDYTQINYYFVVTTTHTPGKNHLTEAEQDSRTVVEWHTFDEMVRLINEQEFDRVQGKYLKMRDVVALQEYTKLFKEGPPLEKFILIRPTSEYASQLAEYRQEFLAADSSMDGCGPLRRFEDPNEYIQMCKYYEDHETVPSHLVPATQFLFIRKSDNKLVGMIQIRHRFNDFLEKYAGHIGYSVRPSERRKGYAKEMLKTALPFCREIGIDKVLIACIDGNIGSEKTILANGGVYESTVHEPNGDRDLKRFWITL